MEMSDIQWQKSSHSTNNGESACVELARTATTLLLRESDAPDLIATATPARARSLLLAVKRGAFESL
jgi:Domain of unknown function (DUF397)